MKLDMTEWRMHADRLPTAWVIGVAALLGAALGVLVKPVWTDNLIPAQIIAGVVEYPADSLVPLTYLRPHSLVTQLAALLLWMGIQEWYVSLIFSGLQGALACAALTTLALAISRHWLSAAITLALIVKLSMHQPRWIGMYVDVFHGHMYPNTFPAAPGVFGAVGLYLCILILGLIGLERWKAAALPAALLPFIHPGLALPLYAALLPVAWLGRARVGDAWPGVAQMAAIGFGIGVVSLAAYFLYLPSSPVVDLAAARTFARQIVERWNDHTLIPPTRRRHLLLEPAFHTLLLGTLLLTRWRSLLPPGVRAVAAVVLTMTVISAAFTVTLAYAPTVVPWQMRTALIPRWMNVASWFFIVVTGARLAHLALVGGHRFAALLLAGTLIAVQMALVQGITFWSGFGAAYLATPATPLKTALYFLSGVGPLGLVLAVAFMQSRAVGRPTHRVPRWWVWLATAAVLVMCALPFQRSRWYGAGGTGACHVALAEASRFEGTLLLAPRLWAAEWIQARTRRPFLFEVMDINILPFTPAVLPRAAQMLDEIYHQPIPTGMRSELALRWPERTTAQWVALAAKYGFVDVIANNTLPLQLPLVVDDGVCAYYRIPGAAR